MPASCASRRWPAERDLSDAEATVTTQPARPDPADQRAWSTIWRGRADAAIVNVTSGLAFVPLVDAPTYCATKAAIHSYTLSLRDALAGKVEVIELAPPGVQTTLTPGQRSARCTSRSTISPTR
ncbi:MAG: SDR family NAD(P)-dependent oxidoreductase [Sphingomonas taxi]